MTASPHSQQADKPPSRPRLGLPADELLKLRGRGSDRILTWPSPVLGEDDAGKVVLWDYADLFVTLRRSQGRYRVADIQDNPTGKPWAQRPTGGSHADDS